MQVARPNFFIYREPSGESLESVKDVQSKLNKLGGFRKGMAPHLSYVGNKKLNSATKRMGAEALNGLIHPLPDSSTEPLGLMFKSLVAIGSRIEDPHVMAIFSDTEGTYGAEEMAIRTRIQSLMKTPHMKVVQPHVTLGEDSVRKVDSRSC